MNCKLWLGWSIIWTIGWTLLLALLVYNDHLIGQSLLWSAIDFALFLVCGVCTIVLITIYHMRYSQ